MPSRAPSLGSCPTCKSSRLKPRELEPDLPSMRCPTCSGSFVAFDDYFAWQAKAAQPTAPAAAQGSPVGAADAGPVKLCPGCGRFMARFRIAEDIPFHIDRCGGCAGMWFERGEWDQLRARGVHTRVNTFFSDARQHQIQAAESARQQEERYRSLLGEADLRRAAEFREWANAHAKRSIIYAYLDAREAP